MGSRLDPLKVGFIACLILARAKSGSSGTGLLDENMGLTVELLVGWRGWNILILLRDGWLHYNSLKLILHGIDSGWTAVSRAGSLVSWHDTHWLCILIMEERALVFETDLEMRGAVVTLDFFRDETSNGARITFVIKINAVHGLEIVRLSNLLQREMVLPQFLSTIRVRSLHIVNHRDILLLLL